MAKQKKQLQQLDLFGALFAEEPSSDNQESILNEQAPSPIEHLQTEEIPVNALPKEPTGNVVFSDDKITVKIKLKQDKEPLLREAELTSSFIAEATTSETPQTAIIVKPVLEQKVEGYQKRATNQSANQLAEATNSKSKRGRKSFKEMDAEIGLVNVPDEATLKQKLYYPIREVAGFFNVNTSLIRAWESEFDILQPRKNRKGDRLFRVEDIKNLQVIYYLLRNKKFSIDGAKKYLKENRGKMDTNQQIVQSLTKFRAFLVEMKANLQA